MYRCQDISYINVRKFPTIMSGPFLHHRLLDIKMTRAWGAAMTLITGDSERDDLVRTLVGFLSLAGFIDIRANIEAYKRPARISWQENEEPHIPDATAQKDGRSFVFEVITQQSAESQSTQARSRLFAAAAKQLNGSFVIVVPKAAMSKVLMMLDRLRLDGEIWSAEGLAHFKTIDGRTDTLN